MRRYMSQHLEEQKLSQKGAQAGKKHRSESIDRVRGPD
jgi:hypothetical protein